VGPAAYVVDGVNGLLIPKNNVDALANAMRRVVDEPGLAATLVAGGRTSYEATFTRAAFVRDSLAFYERVVRESPR
jgi:glycosyltransferase involved in cell wall biosynthesis